MKSLFLFSLSELLRTLVMKSGYYMYYSQQTYIHTFAKVICPFPVKTVIYIAKINYVNNILYLTTGKTLIIQIFFDVCFDIEMTGCLSKDSDQMYMHIMCSSAPMRRDRFVHIGLARWRQRPLSCSVIYMP